MKISYLWTIAVVGLIIIMFAWPTRASSTPETVPVVATPDALDHYLSRLATYECTGLCKEALAKGEPFKLVDANGLYSYGCLQFQQATYLMEAKRYGTDPWANGGIYNCANQMALARRMFLKDAKAASQNWYTSIYTRGLGLPPSP